MEVTSLPPAHSSHHPVGFGSSDPLAGGRRKLPKTPANVAELMIEFAVDSERQELATTLVAARGLLATPFAFVLIQVLPGGQ